MKKRRIQEGPKKFPRLELLPWAEPSSLSLEQQRRTLSREEKRTTLASATILFLHQAARTAFV